MNDLSKEERDMIALLESYVSKLKTSTLSYEEQLNVTEFYIQHQHTIARPSNVFMSSWFDDIVLDWLFRPLWALDEHTN